MENSRVIKLWENALLDNSAPEKLKSPDGRIWIRNLRYNSEFDAKQVVLAQMRDKAMKGQVQVLGLRNSAWIYVVEEKKRKENKVKPICVIRVLENGSPVNVECFTEEEKVHAFEDIKQRKLLIISVKDNKKMDKGGVASGDKILKVILKNATKHLTNKDRYAVEQKYQDSVKYNYTEFCDKCGRGIKGNPAFYIHMVAPDNVVPKDEENDNLILKFSIKGEVEDMGFYPIGSECVKAYPKQYHYPSIKSSGGSMATGGGVEKKREKIFLGGYEAWLDTKNYPSLMIYNTEKSQHGIPVDVLGGGNKIWIASTKLSQEEKGQLVDYLKSGSMSTGGQAGVANSGISWIITGTYI